MLKSEALQLLSDKVATCTKCPDLAANRKQTVFGEGNPSAKIVLTDRSKLL